MRLKINDSHIACKVAYKCLNVCERVEVVERNKKWSPLFPCCPVSHQCPWKKTLGLTESWCRRNWQFFIVESTSFVFIVITDLIENSSINSKEKRDTFPTIYMKFSEVFFSESLPRWHNKSKVTIRKILNYVVSLMKLQSAFL